MKASQKALFALAAVHSLSRQSDGSYVLLNLFGKPIGFRMDEVVNAETDPRCILIPQIIEKDKKDLDGLTATRSCMDRIYLFDTNILPKTTYQVKEYWRRLEFLKTLGPINRQTRKPVNLIPFTFEKREIVVFDPSLLLN